MNAIKFALLGLVGVIGLVVSTFGPFKIPYAETLAKAYYRYAIAGLLVVVCLFAVLVVVAIHLLDPNQFKAQIIRYVQEHTQRELTLDGELELSWFPKLGVKAGKASLSQHRSAREFAAIDSAHITIAWLPLMHRQLQIDWAEVDGLRAQLVRFKDGSTNIDDLLRDLATISPAHVDVEGLHLTRAALQWNDEVIFQRGSLNDLQLTLGRFTDGLAAPLSASVRVDAPQAGVDARVSLKARLLFDAQARRIELAKIDAQLEGKSLGVDNLALNMKADLTGHLGLSTLSVENLVITASSKSGLSVFNARLAAPELRLIERRFQGNQLSMDLSIAHPDQTLTAALQVPSFEGNAQTLRGATANVQLSLRGAATHLSAQLSSPVVLEFETSKRLEFDAIDLTAAANHPLLSAQTPLTANGKLVLDFAQQSVHLALAGKLSGSDLRGQVALSDWRRPHWTFEFASAGLDLDALLAQPCLTRWGDDAVAFDVAYLRDLSLAGQLRADKVKLCGMTASNLSAQFDAQRSALQIAPLTAQVYGGMLDLVVSIDAAGAPRLASKGSLADVDLRAAHADVVHLPWLEGRGELTWDVRTEGGSVGTLRAGAAGPVSLAARAGKLAGIDLRAALLDGRSELGKQGGARQREFNAASTTSFSEMKARFELNEGRAAGQNLELHSSSINAVGSGELTFDTGAIDLRFDASVARPTQEFTGFAGVSVPIQVDGAWRLPRFTLDFGGASGLSGATPPRPSDAVAEPAAIAPHGLALSALPPRPQGVRAGR